MKGFVRVAVSLLAATIVWVVAPRCALAAAPLCDARGAIMFAPPPTLDEPTTSMDVDASDAETCSSHAVDAMLEHGRAPSSSSSSVDSIPRASLVSPIVVTPATPTSDVLARIEHFAAPRGVRTRLDRPPRA